MSTSGFDAHSTRPDRPRRTTLEGHKFGDVSYAADVKRPSEELLRRSVAAMAVEIAERSAQMAPRVTGSRRRSC